MDHSSSRRRRVMDAEGGRAVQRDRRSRMLTVVAVLQYVLVIACLLVTFYVYWNSNRDAQRLPAFEDDVHIGFVASVDNQGNRNNTPLKFVDILSSKLMNRHNDFKISVNCSGPYVFYMNACYKSLNKNDTGTLQLLVARSETPAQSETPVSSLTLTPSDLVCRGLHSIAYLKKNDEVSVQLMSTSNFKLVNVTGGLHFLLGSHCEY